jgi:hypothetical protein
MQNCGLLVVLYGCGTWCLILREDHRLRVFEIRVLRRLFGPKRDEVTGGLRKEHNEELRTLYASPSVLIKNDQVKEDELGRAGWERRGMHIGPCSEIQQERDH